MNIEQNFLFQRKLESGERKIKKANLFLIIILASFTLTSCGMKRALTLPKNDQAETPNFSEDLNNSQSIDVLTPPATTKSSGKKKA